MQMICQTCKCPKHQSEFWKQPKNESGYESSCKQCRMNRRYEQRRERRIEQGLTVKFPTLANRQLAAEGMKYCPGCKQVKSLKEFSTMKVRSGVASHCRECTATWGRQYTKTPQGKKVKQTAYRRNREKMIDRALQRKFGITLKEYKEILDKQSGTCIICGRTPKENGKMLAVDHNHVTGQNRDILCNNCNVIIGFIEKNKTDTKKLEWYLERHNINR